MYRKRILIGISAALGMLILILDSKTALSGAKEGIDLCIQTVIPSLFPFFFLSILLSGSLMGEKLPLLRPVGRIMGIPEGAETILISAFLGGYPSGAQAVAQGFQKGAFSPKTAERLLAFCNNAGPSFLFGMTAYMFPNQITSWILWGIHIFSAMMVSLVLPREKAAPVSVERKNTPFSRVLSASVGVMGSVCAWVVLFRVVIAFLDRWVLWLLPTEVKVALMGLLELSNGCCALPLIGDMKLRFLICSGLLALGGLCVTLQTVSVTNGLGRRQYIVGKLMQCIISIITGAAIIYRFWILLIVFPLFFLIVLGKNKISCSNSPALRV